jgi:hypothetical protein
MLVVVIYWCSMYVHFSLRLLIMNRVDAALQSTCDGAAGGIYGPRYVMGGTAVAVSYTYLRWTQEEAIAMLDAAGISYIRCNVERDNYNVNRGFVIVPVSEWN